MNRLILVSGRQLWKVIAGLILIVFALAPGVAWGQGEASINGAVSDTSGALIPGAMPPGQPKSARQNPVPIHRRHGLRA
jgi:hypothetical protein